MGEVFRNEIISGLNENNIFLIDNTQIDKKQAEFVNNYFEENMRQHIQPLLLIKNKITPFLKNKRLYIVVRLSSKSKKKNELAAKRVVYKYALVEIPTDFLPRFVEIPSTDKKNHIIFLDELFGVAVV